MLFPSETNTNLQTLWSPPSVPTGAVLKLGGSCANQQAEASGQAPILSTVLHSNVSPGVHPHRDQPSCHKPRLDKMVSAGGPQLRGTHDQWLVKRLNPVPIVIGDDFGGLFCGSALLGLSPSHTRFPGCGADRFLASPSPFSGPWVFRRWLVFLLVFVVFPSPLIRLPFLIILV